MRKPKNKKKKLVNERKISRRFFFETAKILVRKKVHKYFEDL